MEIITFAANFKKMSITEILNKTNLEKEDIKILLASEGDDKKLLFDKALQTKLAKLDNYVHLRGLIEYSNICTKYCLYCGVRCKNLKVERYQLSDEEVIECAKLAHELGYGSVALQSGERSDKAFVDKITYLVQEIKKIGNGSLGITLSLGEQTEETYRRWFEAGATVTCSASKLLTKTYIIRFTRTTRNTTSSNA